MATSHLSFKPVAKMVTTTAFTGLFALVLAAQSHTAFAQVYKWVDENGKVTYSDVPPPKSVKKVEKKSIAVADNNAALPVDLAAAVKNMPVTLYTGEKCAACDSGRQYLQQSGIPFNEKTVKSAADIEKLKQVGGDLTVPILFVGSTKLKGFSATEWRTTLTQASYPTGNKLPPDYQFPAPQPAAPIINKTENSKPAQSPQADAPAKIPEQDSKGFKF